MKFIKDILALQERVIGMNARNHQLVYPNNPRKYYILANDKVQSKAILVQHNIPTPQTYQVITATRDIRSCWQTLETLNAVCIKPAMGSGGGGILILKKEERGQWTKPSGAVMERKDIEAHLANILFGMYSSGASDKVILEYCLHPHPFFTEIYSDGVPDFRIIMLDQKPVLAMLRMPNDRSDGKANLHMGALGIGIDMSTGRLGSGFDGRQYVDHHPDTGVLFAGKPLPEWEKTLSMALETAKLFPLNYLGIDIVYDRDSGPMVIEINARPGIEIQNVNQKGLRSLLDG